MKGAIVFLVVFLIVIVLTLAVPDLPPGRYIYDALNVPDTDYPVLGYPATTLIIAIFNGAIFGVIAWLIYSLTFGRKKPETKENKPEAPGDKPAT